MVPPGPHCVCYAAAGSQGGYAPTTCFFVHPRGGEVVARRWRPDHEALEPLEDEDEVRVWA